MSLEILEHELNQLNGHTITVVRPGFGTQSDSWKGFLFSHTGTYPIKFEFQSVGIVILFTAEDVMKLEQIIDIVRLKGPTDYVSYTTPVNA